MGLNIIYLRSKSIFAKIKKGKIVLTINRIFRALFEQKANLAEWGSPTK